MHLEAQRACLPRGLAFEGLAEVSVQLGIIGFPNAVPDLDSFEIHRPAAKGQFDEAISQRAYAIDTAPFFREIRAPRIKADAITGLERAFELEADSIGSHG
jgi:hypothetical protein